MTPLSCLRFVELCGMLYGHEEQAGNNSYHKDWNAFMNLPYYGGVIDLPFSYEL
jgi:hypothetical protein